MRGNSKRRVQQIVLFLIGLFFNTVVLIIYSIGIFSKKLTNKLIALFEKILKFFKIKHFNKVNKSIDEELKLFHKSAEFIKKNNELFGI